MILFLMAFNFAGIETTLLRNLASKVAELQVHAISFISYPFIFL